MADDISEEEREAEEELTASLEAIVRAISMTTGKVIMGGFKNVMQMDHIREASTQGLLPYIYAAGFLSFSGREISEENLAKAVDSVGIRPDPNMIKSLLKTGIKSHLMYVYIYYYLMALGRERTVDNIVAVAKEFGIDPDVGRIGEAIAFIQQGK